jgi:hypothetical protein
MVLLCIPTFLPGWRSLADLASILRELVGR